MKTYFIASDIHGFYDEWIEELIDSGFDKNNPEHIIIVAGDLLDRGTQPLECLEFVNNLPDDRKVLIKGNHEDLLEEVFRKKYFERHDIHNGTDITVSALAGSVQKGETQKDIIERASQNPAIIKYLNSCVDFWEKGNIIVTHGWIPSKAVPSQNPRYLDLPEILRPTIDVYDPNWRESDSWDEARWDNGMARWNGGIREPGKTIICGHYHCSWGHSNLHNDGKEFLDQIETMYINPDTGNQEPHVNWEPFSDDGILAIDRCTAYTHRVNVIILTEDDFE